MTYFIYEDNKKIVNNFSTDRKKIHTHWRNWAHFLRPVFKNIYGFSFANNNLL